ncbi:hypothetical protein A0256_03305 [Mucilaginibacter sp. PAMC 26640]|nr:hypothetical protein A0256_03305 [Mucilaginibacter sp. PAMC 26640]
MPTLNPEQLFRQKARAFVQNKYGESFHQKATDEFCVSLYANLSLLRQSAADFLEDAAAVSNQPDRAASSVIELNGESFEPAEAGLKDPNAWAQLLQAIKGVNDSPIDLVLNARQIVRQQHLTHHRDRVLKRTNELVAFLGKSVANSYALKNRSLLEAPEANELCWLNQTIRSIASPDILADLAADEQVVALDLPRQLVAEVDVTGPAVKAPDYRSRFSKTGKGIVVAVIDSEVFAAHPAFGGRVIQRKNYTLEAWGNPHYHGTAVAGIIAADDPQYPGMAPGATIYNYKVLTPVSTLNANDFQGFKAIQDALEDGANIANCSWGTGPAGNGSSRGALAFDNAWNLGLTLVKSAGNEGKKGRSTLTAPADAQGVIVVGATNRAGSFVCDYSSRGPIAGRPYRPHMVAPGAASNEKIFTANVAGALGQVGYGTSFAAPHVTGLLALILEAQDLSPDEQRNFMIKLCQQLPTAGLDDQGYGFVSLAELLKTGVV